MNEQIEKLEHGLMVCEVTGTKLVHIEKADAEKILALLKEQESEEKRILKIVWDILHNGVSTDTEADQDWVYEQIRNQVHQVY